MLLRVVAQSLRPVKLFSQKLPTFPLFCDRRSVAQQCWIRLNSSSNIVGATHGHCAWITKTYGLYSSHDALQVPICWELLHLFAHHCQHARNNSQHCWRNNVGSCSARLHAAWNTIVHKNTLTFLCCQNENVHLLAHLQLVIHVVQNPGSKTVILESKGCIRTRKTRSSHHLKWNSLLFVFSQFVLCSSILMGIRERWNH